MRFEIYHAISDSPVSIEAEKMELANDGTLLFMSGGEIVGTAQNYLMIKPYKPVKPPAGQPCPVCSRRIPSTNAEKQRRYREIKMRKKQSE